MMMMKPGAAVGLGRLLLTRKVMMKPGVALLDALLHF
jgi:hypothetical protein